MKPVVSYAFGMQKMDFFHQVSGGIQSKGFRLEIQQGLGQRNAASGILFSQTGVQVAYRFEGKRCSFNPYLRYAYAYLGKPFEFSQNRGEFGVLLVYNLSNQSVVPFDLILSGGLGRGVEVQTVNRHPYIDYSINLGIQYAFK